MKIRQVGKAGRSPVGIFRLTDNCIILAHSDGEYMGILQSTRPMDSTMVCHIQNALYEFAGEEDKAKGNQSELAEFQRREIVDRELELADKRKSDIPERLKEIQAHLQGK